MAKSKPVRLTRGLNVHVRRKGPDQKPVLIPGVVTEASGKGAFVRTAKDSNFYRHSDILVEGEEEAVAPAPRPLRMVGPPPPLEVRMGELADFGKTKELLLRTQVPVEIIRLPNRNRVIPPPPPPDPVGEEPSAPASEPPSAPDNAKPGRSPSRRPRAPTTVALAIKTARMAANLNQIELGQLLGTNQSRISLMETGAIAPTKEDVVKAHELFGSALGLSLEELGLTVDDILPAHTVPAPPLDEAPSAPESPKPPSSEPEMFTLQRNAMAPGPYPPPQAFSDPPTALNPPGYYPPQPQVTLELLEFLAAAQELVPLPKDPSERTRWNTAVLALYQLHLERQ
jgi:transcriptional regulator with XRE-family HTH domain